MCAEPGTIGVFKREFGANAKVWDKEKIVRLVRLWMFLIRSAISFVAFVVRSASFSHFIGDDSESSSLFPRSLLLQSPR